MEPPQPSGIRPISGQRMWCSVDYRPRVRQRSKLYRENCSKSTSNKKLMSLIYYILDCAHDTCCMDCWQFSLTGSTYERVEIAMTRWKTLVPYRNGSPPVSSFDQKLIIFVILRSSCGCWLLWTLDNFVPSQSVLQPPSPAQDSISNNPWAGNDTIPTSLLTPELSTCWDSLKVIVGTKISGIC